METFKGRESPKEKEGGEVPEFHTPFCNITLKEFAEAVPEQTAALATVLQEIDSQGIGNFAVFESEKFPGVSFSHTKLTITNDLIQRLAKTTPDLEGAELERGREETSEPVEKDAEEGVRSKRHDYFVFTAFVPPPDGFATVQDTAIDRYIRLIPSVTSALARGETPPEVNVYILGYPTGFAGSVTPEFIESLKEKGFETYGELYAEFVEKKEGSDPTIQEVERPRVVLQGVSKGALVAEKTSKYLSPELKERAQRLLDNPAGDHADHPMRWLKGAELAVGFGAESAARMIGDDTLKHLMKRGGSFVDHMSQATGIEKDNAEQSGLKWKATIADVATFVKGSSLDTEETRSFIRRGMLDPLTFSPKRLFDIWRKSGKEIAGENGVTKDGERKKIGVQFYQRGRSVEIPFKDTHMFFYNRYHRWKTIFEQAQRLSS